MSRCHCSGKNNKRRNWRILTRAVKMSCENDVAVRQDKAVVQCRICRAVWQTNLIEGLRDAK
ncbi:hypothetical protein CPT_Scapp_007 [Serratia phage Scapp]|uniref:Uncharacterized protein n=1 Tax=Serratia phage Scapp TaxID=2282409 RepID=A0A345L6N4_9CAUD|nr:hypothetical protein PP898_gp07 [Serratia phage Scapp]AXH50936.1 hypothetical protein CPT_Scapp_007 [Serratia phage Scapp]